VSRVAISPDESTIASGGADGKIILWDKASGDAKQILTDERTPIEALALSPDGTTIAIGNWQGEIGLWPSAGGKVRRWPRKHTRAVVCLRFSPNGSRLASASHDGTVRLWDVATGTEKYVLAGHTGYVVSVAFSHDGKSLASTGGTYAVGSYSQGEIKLWDLTTGQERPHFRSPAQGALDVAFSPDGKKLIATRWDATALLLDASSGQQLQMLPHQRSGWLMSASWTPDGKTVLCSASNGTIHFWDPDTGNPRDVYQLGPPGQSYIYQVAVSPQGSYGVSANGNGTVYVFRLPESSAVKLEK
jgi:WD40 repeat protein